MRLAKNAKRITLPKTVIPNHYHLSLVTNHKDYTFQGNVKINLSIKEQVNKIVLHSSHLKFNNVMVNQQNKNMNVDVNNVEFNEKEETATIPVNLVEGDSKLTIGFSAPINEKMRGFYQTKFKGLKDEKETACVTQFEPNDARWAFPCFDEPSLKATFDVDITAPKDLVVLSNTPVDKEVDVDAENKKRVFETSPRMSTYLLAFFIGAYQAKSVMTENNVKVSIYAPPSQLERGSWALEVADKTLTYFEKYFDVKYPLKKLDMLVINDFVNGAMENWGLITYRDTAILCDENSSFTAKTYVTHVVAHELAHQWFGNLVTMEWWDQLWLNEGFATFMQNLANDALYKKWEFWLSFMTDVLSPALRLDSLDSSHPVEVPILHSSQINEVFDTISYCKGASVLRMLYHYVGDESFRKGLTKYLNTFKYQNTDSQGLWNHLTEASEGKDIGAFMGKFTLRQGYPVISVKKMENEDSTKLKFHLTQKRFFMDGKEAEGDQKTIWDIPIKVNVGGKIHWIFMNKEEMTFELEKGEGDYVRFNSGSTGFFRVHHSEEIQKTQYEAITNKILSVEDRFMTISDIKAFVTAGMKNISELLSILEKYEKEEDMTVWTSVIGALMYIHRIVRHNDDVLKKFNEFAVKTMSTILEKISFKPSEGEIDRKKKLRGDLISAMDTFKHSATNEFLKEKYNEMVRSNSHDGIESDIFFAVLKSQARNGDKTVFEQLKKIAETAQDPMQKNRALSAMGQFENTEILKDVLKYMMSDKVRDQDKFFVFRSVSHNSKGTDISWKFFVENYDKIREIMSHDSLFSKFVGVVEELDSKELIQEARDYFANKDIKGFEKKLTQAFEMAELNLKVKQREFGNVEKWLSNRS